MKKAIALLLVLAMALSMTACGSSEATSAVAENTSAAAEETSTAEVSSLNWSEYDALITQIRNTADLAERAELMHEAEDMLMDTWCILPIYYYNDSYMMKDYMTDVVCNVFGMKFFLYCQMTNGADEININLSSEPDKIDPALNTTVDGGCLAVNSFEGLLTYNADGELSNGCAESYEVSEDGLTYTFTMRDGLKWSNGEELTAKDFEYSWKRAASVETASDYAYLFEIFADGQYDADGNFIGLGDDAVVASEDGKTLTVQMGSVCPYFLDLCAFPTFFPVYEPSVTAADPDGSNPGAWALDATDAFVCNGAFVLESWNHDSNMTYVKNENYWNADAVSVNKLNYMLSSDSTATYAAYNSGDLDFIDSIPTEEMGTLLAEENPELYIIPYLGNYYVACNYNSDLWSNLGLNEEEAAVFRHALCLLIDRDYIIENIGQTGQEPATTFIPSGCSDGNGGEFKNKDYYSVDDYDANVAEAIELLKSIGFEFDDNNQLTTDVSLTYLTNNSEGNVRIGEALQQDWGQIGINVTIDQEEWNVFLNDRKSGNYDIARNGWIMDYNDPINMLEMWTTNSGNNDCQFGR
jgi:peptide/nickel transport system substrate-binding protein/oligopeptide transport system substrate-binding protein